uniref:Uncharacterized protein n=1 Tax=Chromera velia CCMP2878 TaxID=1169474 RepID=A0A0G4I7Z9_9ALVE|eukprot:Cvel_11724.t1-p1 / transcript=Cvel_11724.t1 / gene=Cvel_11724 / organism=Chromera_velia_CCMP2878 / gene_product=hypothetical protein / transcript_product=hypothetical protein / location=Cvel_scaffold744:10280-27538(-) / protein_length=3457 / sequence_SO=supercontig / SO=protein_coding / is_pseudo=false
MDPPGRESLKEETGETSSSSLISKQGLGGHSPTHPPVSPPNDSGKTEPAEGNLPPSSSLSGQTNPAVATVKETENHAPNGVRDPPQGLRLEQEAEKETQKPPQSGKQGPARQVSEHPKSTEPSKELTLSPSSSPRSPRANLPPHRALPMHKPEPQSSSSSGTSGIASKDPTAPGGTASEVPPPAWTPEGREAPPPVLIPVTEPGASSSASAAAARETETGPGRTQNKKDPEDGTGPRLHPASAAAPRWVSGPSEMKNYLQRGQSFKPLVSSVRSFLETSEDARMDIQRCAEQMDDVHEPDWGSMTLEKDEKKEVNRLKCLEGTLVRLMKTEVACDRRLGLSQNFSNWMRQERSRLVALQQSLEKERDSANSGGERQDEDAENNRNGADKRTSSSGWGGDVKSEEQEDVAEAEAVLVLMKELSVRGFPMRPVWEYPESLGGPSDREEEGGQGEGMEKGGGKTGGEGDRSRDAPLSSSSSASGQQQNGTEGNSERSTPRELKEAIETLPIEVSDVGVVRGFPMRPVWEYPESLGGPSDREEEGGQGEGMEKGGGKTGGEGDRSRDAPLSSSSSASGQQQNGTEGNSERSTPRELKEAIETLPIETRLASFSDLTGRERWEILQCLPLSVRSYLRSLPFCLKRKVSKLIAEDLYLRAMVQDAQRKEKAEETGENAERDKEGKTGDMNHEKEEEKGQKEKEEEAPSMVSWIGDPPFPPAASPSEDPTASASAWAQWQCSEMDPRIPFFTPVGVPLPLTGGDGEGHDLSTKICESLSRLCSLFLGLFETRRRIAFVSHRLKKRSSRSSSSPQEQLVKKDEQLLSFLKQTHQASLTALIKERHVCDSSLLQPNKPTNQPDGTSHTSPSEEELKNLLAIPPTPEAFSMRITRRWDQVLKEKIPKTENVLPPYSSRRGNELSRPSSCVPTPTSQSARSQSKLTTMSRKKKGAESNPMMPEETGAGAYGEKQGGDVPVGGENASLCFDPRHHRMVSPPPPVSPPLAQMGFLFPHGGNFSSYPRPLPRIEISQHRDGGIPPGFQPQPGETHPDARSWKDLPEPRDPFLNTLRHVYSTFLPHASIPLLNLQRMQEEGERETKGETWAEVKIEAGEKSAETEEGERPSDATAQNPLLGSTSSSLSAAHPVQLPPPPFPNNPMMFPACPPGSFPLFPILAQPHQGIPPPFLLQHPAAAAAAMQQHPPAHMMQMSAPPGGGGAFPPHVGALYPSAGGPTLVPAAPAPAPAGFMERPMWIPAAQAQGSASQQDGQPVYVAANDMMAAVPPKRRGGMGGRGGRGGGGMRGGRGKGRSSEKAGAGEEGEFKDKDETADLLAEIGSDDARENEERERELKALGLEKRGRGGQKRRRGGVSAKAKSGGRWAPTGSAPPPLVCVDSQSEEEAESDGDGVPLSKRRESHFGASAAAGAGVVASSVLLQKKKRKRPLGMDNEQDEEEGGEGCLGVSRKKKKAVKEEVGTDPSRKGGGKRKRNDISGEGVKEEESGTKDSPLAITPLRLPPSDPLPVDSRQVSDLLRVADFLSITSRVLMGVPPPSLRILLDWVGVGGGDGGEGGGKGGRREGEMNSDPPLFHWTVICLLRAASKGRFNEYDAFAIRPLNPLTWPFEAADTIDHFLERDDVLLEDKKPIREVIRKLESSEGSGFLGLSGSDRLVLLSALVEICVETPVFRALMSFQQTRLRSLRKIVQAEETRMRDVLEPKIMNARSELILPLFKRLGFEELRQAMTIRKPAAAAGKEAGEAGEEEGNEEEKDALILHSWETSVESARALLKLPADSAAGERKGGRKKGEGKKEGEVIREQGEGKKGKKDSMEGQVGVQKEESPPADDASELEPLAPPPGGKKWKAVGGKKTAELLPSSSPSSSSHDGEKEAQVQVLRDALFGPRAAPFPSSVLSLKIDRRRFAIRNPSEKETEGGEGEGEAEKAGDKDEDEAREEAERMEADRHLKKLMNLRVSGRAPTFAILYDKGRKRLEDEDELETLQEYHARVSEYVDAKCRVFAIRRFLPLLEAEAETEWQPLGRDRRGDAFWQSRLDPDLLFLEHRLVDPEAVLRDPLARAVAKIALEAAEERRHWLRFRDREGEGLVETEGRMEVEERKEKGEEKEKDLLLPLHPSLEKCVEAAVGWTDEEAQELRKDPWSLVRRFCDVSDFGGDSATLSGVPVWPVERGGEFEREGENGENDMEREDATKKVKREPSSSRAPLHSSSFLSPPDSRRLLEKGVHQSPTMGMRGTQRERESAEQAEDSSQLRRMRMGLRSRMRVKVEEADPGESLVLPGIGSRRGRGGVQQGGEEDEGGGENGARRSWSFYTNTGKKAVGGRSKVSPSSSRSTNRLPPTPPSNLVALISQGLSRQNESERILLEGLTRRVSQFTCSLSGPLGLFDKLSLKPLTSDAAALRLAVVAAATQAGAHTASRRTPAVQPATHHPYRGAWVARGRGRGGRGRGPEIFSSRSPRVKQLQQIKVQAERSRAEEPWVFGDAHALPLLHLQRKEPKVPDFLWPPPQWRRPGLGVPAEAGGVVSIVPDFCLTHPVCSSGPSPRHSRQMLISQEDMISRWCGVEREMREEIEGGKREENFDEREREHAQALLLRPVRQLFPLPRAGVFSTLTRAFLFLNRNERSKLVLIRRRVLEKFQREQTMRSDDDEQEPELLFPSERFGMEKRSGSRVGSEVSSAPEVLLFFRMRCLLLEIGVAAAGAGGQITWKTGGSSSSVSKRKQATGSTWRDEERKEWMEAVLSSKRYRPSVLLPLDPPPPLSPSRRTSRGRGPPNGKGNEDKGGPEGTTGNQHEGEGGVREFIQMVLRVAPSVQEREALLQEAIEAHEGKDKQKKEKEGKGGEVIAEVPQSGAAPSGRCNSNDRSPSPSPSPCPSPMSQPQPSTLVGETQEQADSPPGLQDASQRERERDVKMEAERADVIGVLRRMFSNPFAFREEGGERFKVSSLSVSLRSESDAKDVPTKEDEEDEEEQKLTHRGSRFSVSEREVEQKSAASPEEGEGGDSQMEDVSASAAVSYRSPFPQFFPLPSNFLSEGLQGCLRSLLEEVRRSLCSQMSRDFVMPDEALWARASLSPHAFAHVLFLIDFALRYRISRYPTTANVAGLRRDPDFADSAVSPVDLPWFSEPPDTLTASTFAPGSSVASTVAAASTAEVPKASLGRTRTGTAAKMGGGGKNRRASTGLLTAAEKEDRSKLWPEIELDRLALCVLNDSILPSRLARRLEPLLYRPPDPSARRSRQQQQRQKGEEAEEEEEEEGEEEEEEADPGQANGRAGGRQRRSQAGRVARGGGGGMRGRGGQRQPRPAPQRVTRARAQESGAADVNNNLAGNSAEPSEVMRGLNVEDLEEEEDEAEAEAMPLSRRGGGGRSSCMSVSSQRSRRRGGGGRGSRLSGIRVIEDDDDEEEEGEGGGGEELAGESQEEEDAEKGQEEDEEGGSEGPQNLEEEKKDEDEDLLEEED